MPLIPAPERQVQADIHESEGSFVFKVSFKTFGTVQQRNHVFKTRQTSRQNNQMKAIIYIYIYNAVSVSMCLSRFVRKGFAG